MAKRRPTFENRVFKLKQIADPRLPRPTEVSLVGEGRRMYLWIGAAGSEVGVTTLEGAALRNLAREILKRTGE